MPAGLRDGPEPGVKFILADPKLSCETLYEETMAGKSNENRLTAQRETFAQAYVELGNASAAYRRAYPSDGVKNVAG